jgi:hypothetical protein
MLLKPVTVEITRTTETVTVPYHDHQDLAAQDSRAWGPGLTLPRALPSPSITSDKSECGTKQADAGSGAHAVLCCYWYQQNSYLWEWCRSAWTYATQAAALRQCAAVTTVSGHTLSLMTAQTALGVWESSAVTAMVTPCFLLKHTHAAPHIFAHHTGSLHLPSQRAFPLNTKQALKSAQL